MRPFSPVRSLTARLRTEVSRLRADRSGGTALVFALSAVPLIAVGGLAVDYSNTVRLRPKLQAAVDSAALAGAAALTKGNTTTYAATLARESVLVNMRDLAPATTVQNTSASIENQTASTVVSAQLAINNVFGKMVGAPTTTLTANATAQAFTGATSVLTRHYSGKGAIANDPEIAFADGTGGFIDCPAGNWYNVLSDAGIQINFSCKPNAGGWNLIEYMTVMVGDHTVVYNAYTGATQGLSGVGYYDYSWPAAISIDNVPYVPANQSYQTWSHPDPVVAYKDEKVTIEIAPHFDPRSNFNATGMYNFQYMTIRTANYKIQLYYENGWGGINFTATNAGLCGIPGGAWGASLGGLNVGYSQPYNGGLTQIGSYQVTTSTSKSPEFYWTEACNVNGQIARSTIPRLIQ